MRFRRSLAFPALLLAALPAAGAAELVADGVADDTAALQALVDRGGDVRLPAGPIRLTAPVVIDLPTVGKTAISGGGAARVVMDGAGPAFRFVGTHDGTAFPNSVNDRVWAKENAPMLDGVEIVGAHPDARGVEATGTMQLTLTRLVVRKALHAVHLVKRNRNVILSDCHLYENRGVGVYMDRVNLHQIGLSNCHISYNDGGGVVAKGSEIRNLQINGCDIEANTGPADLEADVPLVANVWLDATGSSLGEVAIVGCTIQHAHAAPNAANIRIDATSNALRFTDEPREGNVVIANNILSDVQVNIELKNVRGATVVGNTLWQGHTANMHFEGCDRLAVTGNMLDRNPRFYGGKNAPAKLGVRFINCTDCTVTGNHSGGAVDGAAAVIFRDCDRINVTGNTITDYGACGLLLENVTRSLITANLIRDDRPDAAGTPLKTKNLSGVTLTGNLIGDGERGASAP